MSLETEVASLGADVRNLVARVDALAKATESRLNPLWDEYQQQKGERRIIRYWLGALSIVVALVTALHR